MIRQLAVFIMVVIAAGCVVAGKQQDAAPEWVDGSSERYPPGTYLVGIGSAEHLAVARDRARADLAKIFRVSINETSRDEQQYRQQGDAAEYAAEVERELVLRTDQVLEGVTVPESWQDPDSKRYHALAVLDRARAASRLRSDINGLDSAAEVLVNRARVAEDAFTRAKLALEVVENQRRRAALQEMLRAVDPTGRGVAPLWPLARLEADLRIALSRITLDTAGEPEWQQLLAGQLADSGFQVSTSGDYEVRLDVKHNVVRRDGWYWVRGVAVLGVTGADGASLGQKRWEFKESATDESTAMMRFREAVAATLARDGRDAVLGIVRE